MITRCYANGREEGNVIEKINANSYTKQEGEVKKNMTEKTEERRTHKKKRVREGTNMVRGTEVLRGIETINEERGDTQRSEGGRRIQISGELDKQ